VHFRKHGRDLLAYVSDMMEIKKRKKKKQGSVEIAESNIQQAIIITRMATLRLCGLAVDNLHTSAAPGPGGYASQAFAANRAERAQSVLFGEKMPADPSRGAEPEARRLGWLAVWRRK
jgi:hypothetical protein